jgi:hypothetical protein
MSTRVQGNRIRDIEKRGALRETTGAVVLVEQMRNGAYSKVSSKAISNADVQNGLQYLNDALKHRYGCVMVSARQPRKVAIAPIELAGHAAIEIRTPTTRMVVVTDVGPRIAWFGHASGRNLLYWDEERRARRGEFILRGGHRLWVTRPLADEAEESYAPDNQRCRVRVKGHTVEVIAPLDGAKIEKSLRVRCTGGAAYVVEHRVRNCGDMLWSGGAWALTCTRPERGDEYGIPLGTGGNWDAFSMVIPRRWGGGHTSLVADPQLRFYEHALVVHPRGRECKRMIEAQRGLIGMTVAREKRSFFKHVAWDAAGGYPLATNVALYIAPGNTMVEMETMSPVRPLAPGATLNHLERWWLDEPIDWTDARAVQELRPAPIG